MDALTAATTAQNIMERAAADAPDDLANLGVGATAAALTAAHTGAQVYATLALVAEVRELRQTIKAASR